MTRAHEHNQHAMGPPPPTVSDEIAVRATLPPGEVTGPPAMPSPPPVNFVRALKGMWDLTQDKENTTHVFQVIKNVNGDSTRAAFERFCASETGRLAMAEPLRLLTAMSDRERLRALPEDTLGHVYAAFLDREGLSTNGVQEAMIATRGTEDYEALRQNYPFAYAYYWHQNLSHDLYHVLTGYGRDALGEGAVLRFTHAHSGSRGIKFISRFAGIRVRIEDPSIPAGPILREAGRLGREANDFITADWASLLDRPLADVRAELNVGTPMIYLSVPSAKLARIGAAAAPAADQVSDEARLAA